MMASIFTYSLIKGPHPLSSLPHHTFLLLVVKKDDGYSIYHLSKVIQTQLAYGTRSVLYFFTTP